MSTPWKISTAESGALNWLCFNPKQKRSHSRLYHPALLDTWRRRIMRLTGVRWRSLAACFASVLLSPAHVCPAQTLPPPTISPAVDQSCSTLLAAPALQKVFADVRADDSRVLEEHHHLSEIPAPPFKEKARANYFVTRLKALGLSDAYIDSEG